MNSETTRRKYLGVKLVEAEAMDKGSYNDYRGLKIPDDENTTDEGYLVVYLDGYESWCPKKIFEEANRPIDGLTFGHALEAMKKGRACYRVGWNGKGLLVRYMPFIDFKFDEKTKDFKLKEHFQITGDGWETVNTWVPSVSDCCAEDWQILGEG